MKIKTAVVEAHSPINRSSEDSPGGETGGGPGGGAGGGLGGGPAYDPGGGPPPSLVDQAPLHRALCPTGRRLLFQTSPSYRVKLCQTLSHRLHTLNSTHGP